MINNKQRAEEIVNYMNDEIYALEYSDYDKYCAIEKLTQALDEAYARGQQSLLAKMSDDDRDDEVHKAARKYDCYTNESFRGFLAAVNWLRTKLTEGEG